MSDFKHRYVMDSEISSLFKEKIWENGQENGENIVDGYVFRGKRTFEKVVEGLKETLIKNYKNHINGTEMRVLDSRKKGIEIEKEIQVIDGNEKGVATLKLYGPNKKKESVVTVSRSKGQDPKFVVILVEKVLKHLMEELMKGNSIEKVNSKRISKKKGEEKEKKVFKCIHCDKTFYTNQGLKGHITRMHKRKMDDSVENIDYEGDDIKGDTTETETDAEATLEEKSYTKEVKSKEVCCEECNLRIIADRKYIALQNLRKHKDEYHGKNCDKCDYKTRSNLEMKDT